MVTQSIFLLVGLALLLLSADKMIDYSDQVAKRFKLSPILIGLTLVAFGTSAPELVVTLFASFNSPPNTNAVIGNVIGSNIANILLILGLSGLFFDLDFGKINKKDIIFLGVISLFFSLPFFFTDTLNFIYVIGYIIIIIFFLNHLRNYPAEIASKTTSEFSNKTYIFLALSFIGIFFGGKIFLSQALLIFTNLGLSEVIIGMTILAIGTSLPELITVLVSYFKKKGDIGIGNIIGSNIMNILFVFTSSIAIVQLRGFEFKLISINDGNNNIINNNEMIIILLLATFILILLSIIKIRLSKVIAIMLLALYFLYLSRILL